MNQSAQQNKLAENNTSGLNDSTPKQSLGYGKTLRSRSQRRSLSGAPLSCFFETKFQHLRAFQKTQNEARGLNFLLAPMSGALYRSSMPVTPVATPLFDRGGIKFNEQSFHERMRARLQSPREVPSSRIVTEQRESISEAPESQLEVTRGLETTTQESQKESGDHLDSTTATETASRTYTLENDTAQSSSAKGGSSNSGKPKEVPLKSSRRQRRRIKQSQDSNHLPRR